MIIYYDRNGRALKNYDVIDIHQTVNGYDKFVILDLGKKDVRYFDDINREYEYDVHDLLDDIEIEIVDNIESVIIESKLNELGL